MEFGTSVLPLSMKWVRSYSSDPWNPKAVKTNTGLVLGHVFSRDERRWIEKQNKAARQKRKKEETARIRQLVGM